MISEENKVILKKRLLSLIWRTGGMVGIVGLEFITANMGLFDLPSFAVVVIGLVVGELTKILNTKK